MICFVEDKNKELKLYVDDTKLEIRNYSDEVEATYIVDGLYRSIEYMMRLLKIKEEDLYRYSLSALVKLQNNLKKEIRINKVLRTTEDGIYMYDKKLNKLDELKKKMSAKEVFISTVKKYAKHGFDSSKKIEVTSIEQDGVIVHQGDIVKRDNRVAEIEKIEALIDNRNYGIITYWGLIGVKTEKYRDLVKYKRDISEREKKMYIVRREAIGKPVRNR